MIGGVSGVRDGFEGFASTCDFIDRGLAWLDGISWTVLYYTITLCEGCLWIYILFPFFFILSPFDTLLLLLYDGCDYYFSVAFVRLFFHLQGVF